MTDLDDRIRDLLHDERWALPAWPDPMARLGAARRRRTRRRQQVFAAGAVAAVVTVAASVVVPALDPDHPAPATRPVHTAHRQTPSTPATHPQTSTASGARCQPGWHVSPQPFASGDRQRRLLALGAASANDAWAVGERWVESPYRSRPRVVTYPLIEHWDGHAWTDAPVADPNHTPGVLHSITVISPTDAWAVGGYQAETQATRNAPLIEHWNGVTWSPTPVPALVNTGRFHEQTLIAVAGISPNDVWALGNASPNGATYLNRLLHWNGQNWIRVTAAEPSTTSGLGSVSLLTALAIDPTTGSPWAVGGHIQGVGENFTFDGALVASRTGANWTGQQSPTGLLPLNALSIAGQQDLWAIRRPALAASPEGTAWGGKGPSSVLRWNGTQWTTMLTTPGTLSGLEALTDRDVWTAGRANGPLLMHWNGTAWTTVANSAPVNLPDGLFAITVANDQTVLALGTSSARADSQNAIWTQCPATASK